MFDSPRSVVAITENSEHAALLVALAGASEFDIVVVETATRGYSRIKTVMPDLVVVDVEIDNPEGCQLLSMLKIDGALSGIRVVTLATGGENLPTN